MQMKRNIGIAIGLLLVLSSCHKQYMTGYYNWEEFQQKAEWKTFVDEKYKPKENYMDSLASLQGREPVNVRLFLGTYCPDSKKWVPRFFAIKDKLPVADVEIVSVDTTKKDERMLAQQSGLKKIPTFIFYDQGGKELGRIVEKPKGRLEKRIYEVLKNE